jgi:hypothetical protein
MIVEFTLKKKLIDNILRYIVLFILYQNSTIDLFIIYIHIVV